MGIKMYLVRVYSETGREGTIYVQAFSRSHAKKKAIKDTGACNAIVLEEK